MGNQIGCVLSIGNFDGVHLGHQELIRKSVKLAQAEGLRTIIMTLDPHPLKLLVPEKNLKSILELPDKVAFLKALGADEIFILKFSRDISNLEPSAFYEKYVLEQFGARDLVVGYDFNFGKNRSGTLEVAEKLCRKNNIGFTVVEPFKIESEIVSSSKIRNFISSGNVEKAQLFLGRPFYLSGMIQKGAGRGKKIGFPTANLFSKNELFPQKGVYISQTEFNGTILNGVTNVGDNPTFEKTAGVLKIETHFLNFDKDIYGEKIKVSFLKRLRDEKKFPTIEALVKQINLDLEQAKKEFT